MKIVNVDELQDETMCLLDYLLERKLSIGDRIVLLNTVSNGLMNLASIKAEKEVEKRK